MYNKHNNIKIYIIYKICIYPLLLLPCVIVVNDTFWDVGPQPTSLQLTMFSKKFVLTGRSKRAENVSEVWLVPVKTPVFLSSKYKWYVWVVGRAKLLNEGIQEI